VVKRGNLSVSPKDTKNPQRRSSRPSSKNSSMLNPSRNSAKNATSVSPSVIGSSFGRHLQTHPFPKSGRCTCKPSATFPPQPRIQQTQFGLWLPSDVSLIPFLQSATHFVRKASRSKSVGLPSYQVTTSL
jgi:hypothetical protein